MENTANYNNYSRYKNKKLLQTKRITLKFSNPKPQRVNHLSYHVFIVIRLRQI